jgi:hypothetical protein
MILGRLRKDLVQQDWIAITVDIVVVIISILLAFQIERWADDLRSRNLEQDYLLRLQQDLETEVTRMDQALDNAQDRIQAVKFLDQAVNDSSIVIDSPSKLPWALETATWRSYPQINAFVFGELQSSGNLTLIRSESLRRNLTNHYTTLQHYSHVGLDLQAQHQFEQVTAGILSIDELVAVESNSWASDPYSVSEARALEIVDDFSRKEGAIALLPSLVQHHTFNKKVMYESKERVQEIIVQIDTLLSP